MSKVLMTQQNNPNYQSTAPLPVYQCVNNPAYQQILQAARHFQTRSLIVGKQEFGGQLPLSDLPAIDSKFSNMGLEMAYHSQEILQMHRLPLAVDFYETHTEVLCELYLLNTCLCFHQFPKKDGSFQSNSCTRFLQLIKTVPGITSQDLNSAYEYFEQDLEKQLRSRILNAVTAECNAKGIYKLRKVKVNAKHILAPTFTVELRMNNFLRVSQRNVINLRYAENEGTLTDLTCTYRTDILSKYCNPLAVDSLIARCFKARNNLGEITIPVLNSEQQSNDFKTINMFRICKMSKA